MSEEITSEKQAKRVQEEAMGMLAEVREWVSKNGQAWLPEDPDAPVTRQQAEAHAAYMVWYFTVKDAMHMMDPGWDEQKVTKLPNQEG